MHRGILDFSQKSVDHRTSPKYIPACPCRLAKNDVRNTVLTGVFEKGISDIVRFELYDLCPEGLGKFYIFL